MSSLHPTPLRVQGHDDVMVNVWDYGGTGPALVLSHCTGTCARVWDPVVVHLQETYRVLAVDSRGHGDSEKPEDVAAYQWHHSGDDLRAVIAQLDLGDTVYAVGHSAGGAHVVYALLQEPGLFTKVMLIDSVIVPPAVPLGNQPLADSALRRRSSFNSKAEALGRFSAKPPMDTWHADCLEAYVAHGLDDEDDGSVTLKCPPTIESAVYKCGGAHDIFEPFTALDDTLITLVTGETSYVKPLVELHHQSFPEATLHEVPDAGHFIPQEHPRLIAELIVATF